MAKKEERFVVTYVHNSLSKGNTRILVDTQTGVNYLWHSEGYGAGLTPLLDREGKPIISGTAQFRHPE